MLGEGQSLPSVDTASQQPLVDNSKPVVTQMVLAKLTKQNTKAWMWERDFVESGCFRSGGNIREGEVYKTLKEQI